MPRKKFTVIRFTADNSTDYVPTGWIFNQDGVKKVKFPKTKNSKTTQLQQDSDSSPNPVWPEWELVTVKSYG